MNILDLKRKSLGYHAMGGGGGTGGGGGSSSDPMGAPNAGPPAPSMGTPNEGPQAPSSGTRDWSDPTSYGISQSDLSAPTGPSPTNSEISTSTGFDSNWGTGGWSTGSSSGPLSGSAWNNAPAPEPAAASATTRSLAATDPNAPVSAIGQEAPAEKSLAQKTDILGRLAPEMSLNPNMTQEAQQARMGVTGPKDDAFTNGGMMTQQQKDQFASWDKPTQNAYLGATGKPVGENYTYDPVNPGWRESVTNFTTPDKGSLAEKLGIGGAGVTANQALTNETQAHRNERMGIIGDAIGRVGNFALSGVASSMGLGPALTGLRAYAAYDQSQKTDKPMSAMDAVKAAMTDIGGGMIAGRINGELGKALGPTFGQANQLGSLYGLATGNSVPNVGASVVNSLKSELGLTGVPNTRTVSAPNGTEVMQVGNVATGGWSSGNGGGGSSQQPAQQAPQAPQAAPKQAPANDIIDGSFGSLNLGLLGRNMRKRK